MTKTKHEVGLRESDTLANLADSRSALSAQGISLLEKSIADVSEMNLRSTFFLPKSSRFEESIIYASKISFPSTFSVSKFSRFEESIGHVSGRNLHSTSFLSRIYLFGEPILCESKAKVLYEGKAKVLYEGPEPGTLIQHFKDDTTAFNSKKREVIEGKGVLNNRISEFLLLRLEEIGIPTHFIKSLNKHDQLVRQVEIIPLEVVVRNIAAGSLVKRTGMTEGDALLEPRVEFFYKDDALGDPLVTEDYINAFGWAAPHEIEEITALALRVNDFMSDMFASVGIRLVDFKLEFGRLREDGMTRIVLADEISPDNCRLWDMSGDEKLDKDRFRHGIGGMLDTYQEVASRLGVVKETVKGVNESDYLYHFEKRRA